MHRPDEMAKDLEVWRAHKRLDEAMREVRAKTTGIMDDALTLMIIDGMIHCDTVGMYGLTDKGIDLGEVTGRLLFGETKGTVQ